MIVNIVSIDTKFDARLRRAHPRYIPNLVTTEQVSIPPNPKTYSMIEQLKTTILYDLISTFETHRKILYALFKKEIVLTNMLATIFFEKLGSIKECDATSFYRSKNLSKKLLDECIALYITPMIHG